MESGLKICKDMLFVRGSHDRIVICSCCGTRGLEVKCPFTTRHLSPTDKDAKLAFMTTDENGKYHLKKNHPYYTQCKVEMAVNGVTNNIFMCGLLMVSTRKLLHWTMHTGTNLKPF